MREARRGRDRSLAKFGAMGIMVLFAAAVLLLLPGDSAAQSPAVPQGVPGERSPVVASLLQAAFPPLPIGYLYAGDPVRGLLPSAVMVGGATLFMVQVIEIIDWTDEGGSDELMYVGLAALFGGYVYGIVDAAAATRDRNARLRAREARLMFLPAPGGIGIGVSLAAR
jgi:hypothetical protein